MTSQLTDEMERLFALSKVICSGEEIAFDESHEMPDGTSVILLTYKLYEYMLTFEGSGEDMSICVRSISIPSLYLVLPPPAFVRIGKGIQLEELC